jgi:hypothetical protein
MMEYNWNESFGTPEEDAAAKKLADDAAAKKIADDAAAKKLVDDAAAAAAKKIADDAAAKKLADDKKKEEEEKKKKDSIPPGYPSDAVYNPADERYYPKGTVFYYGKGYPEGTIRYSNGSYSQPSIRPYPYPKSYDDKYNLNHRNYYDYGDRLYNKIDRKFNNNDNYYFWQATNTSAGWTVFGIFIAIFLFIWGIAGFVAFFMSLICLFYNGSATDKTVGVIMGVLFGPFYWLYYIYNMNYCTRY